VVAAQPLSINPPLGVTYHSIGLRFTIAGVPATLAEIIAQVAKVRLIFDGDAYIDASAAELIVCSNFWNARYGLVNVVDGVLTISASRPWEQESTAQDGPAWGCATNAPGCIGTFELEVTLVAGATIDGIVAVGEVTNGEPMGRHLTIRRIGDNMGAAGDKTLFDWPKFGLDVGVYAIHIDKTGGTGNLITSIQMEVDQIGEIPRVPYGFLQAQFRRYGLTQQTGYTHIPFNKRGRPLDALPMVMQDLRLTLECSAALNNFSAIIEGLEGEDPKAA
jgi:hypothetical protein